ncbi:MAG: alpha/beta hydrolase [Terracidiphilus sp.]
MAGTRQLALWGIACGAGWLVLCAAIGLIATEGALHPERSPLSSSEEQKAQSIADRNHAVLTDVAITADDGVNLRAWNMRPFAGNGEGVILLHGQGDNRAGMLANADMLLRHGYAVLLPDSRAQGESGGLIATYGVQEAADVRRWYDWLHSSLSPRCIDGLGDSMGAAQLLRSLEVEPAFCAVVAESSFATFQEAANDRLGQQFNVGPWLGRTLLRPAFWAGLGYARLRYGVDLMQASPENAVAHSQVPILLIHGLADTNLPSRHSEMMKAVNPAVVLWEPMHAGHCEASTTAPAEYESRVIGWFASHDRRAMLAAAHCLHTFLCNS